jgi:hypothetical protein
MPTSCLTPATSTSPQFYSHIPSLVHSSTASLSKDPTELGPGSLEAKVYMTLLTSTLDPEFTSFNLESCTNHNSYCFLGTSMALCIQSFIHSSQQVDHCHHFQQRKTESQNLPTVSYQIAEPAFTPRHYKN